MRKILLILFLFAIIRASGQTISASSNPIVLAAGSTYATTTLTASGFTGPITWTKYYDVTLPVSTTGSWPQSIPPTDNALLGSSISFFIGNPCVITNMVQGTWYYQAQDGNGHTARIVINVDIYSQPANSVNIINFNLTDATTIANVNDRSMDTTIHYGEGGTYNYIPTTAGSYNTSAYLARDRQQLQWIDNMRGKFYGGGRDGVGGYNGAGAFSIIDMVRSISGTSNILKLTAGNVYVFETKVYYDRSFAALARANNVAQSGDAFFYETHGASGTNGDCPGCSNSFSVAYKYPGDSLAPFESIALNNTLPGNINGYGTTQVPPANFGHDYYGKAFAAIDDFYNKAHTLRFTIKLGDNGTGAFQKLEYDGKQVYLRNTGNVGQSYRGCTGCTSTGGSSPPNNDYPDFTQIYDNDQKFFQTNGTLHRQGSVVVEKIQGYVMTGNNPPVANAGQDQSLSAGTSSTTLDGSYSRSDGGYITGYLWQRTAGSGSITSSTSSTTGITGLANGTNTFSLRITDNNGNTNTNSVNIIVGNGSAPTINSVSGSTNLPFKAIGTQSTSLTANATGSDGTISYHWTTSSSATIGSALLQTTSIGNLVNGNSYIVNVQATDANGSSAQYPVTITVAPTAIPIAIITPQTINYPSTITNLVGDASTDQYGKIASYAWTQISGSAVYITNANQATASVSGMNYGFTYDFRLTVTDTSGLTSTAIDTVYVPYHGVSNPHAYAGNNATITSLTLSPVILDGSGSSTDVPPILNYTWVQLPTSPYTPSVGTLKAQVKDTITIPVTTVLTYKFQLTIRDTMNNYSLDTVTISVLSNPIPTANAGINQNITVNNTTLIGSGTGYGTGVNTGLTYLWQQTSGIGTITSPTSATTTITGLSQGVNTFTFKVTDNQNQSIISTPVTITYSPTPPPPPAGTSLWILWGNYKFTNSH